MIKTLGFLGADYMANFSPVNRAEISLWLHDKFLRGKIDNENQNGVSVHTEIHFFSVALVKKCREN